MAKANRILHSLILFVAVTHVAISVGAGNKAAVAAGGAATVSGKATFKGTAPKSEMIRMNADPVCAKANTKPVPKGDVVVNSNGTLANVLVYVKDAKKDAAAPAPTAVTLDQTGCVYHPRVLGVQVNQPIKILNSDPVLHNVHSLPKSNTGFNLGMATKGQTVEKKFTKAEAPFRVKCDVHGWMVSHIGVFDHPFFGVTDATGGFTIKDLPAGEYTVEAWHEKLGTKTAKLTVPATGGAQTLDFAFGS